MAEETTVEERFLEVGGRRFAAVAALPAWQLMRLAKAEKSDDTMARMAGVHDFIRAVLTPEARDEFEAFMDERPEAAADLDTAVAALMTSYTARPTARPSSSVPGPLNTGPTSRVVSLSGARSEPPSDSRTGPPAA